MRRRKGQYVFAFLVGAVVAVAAYRWITDPAPREERRREEAAVHASRLYLAGKLGIDDLEIVDPLARNRAAGKAYVYRSGSGWEVSGYYRRSEQDRWHPFLMSLDATNGLLLLKVGDAGIASAAAEDPALEVVP